MQERDSNAAPLPVGRLRDGETTAPSDPDDGSGMRLTLADAVFIALRGNRTIQSAYLDRIAQRFDLRVAENKFTPRGSITASTGYERTDTATTRQSTRSTAWRPEVTWLAPTGAQFGFAWTNQIANQNPPPSASGTILSAQVVQPLLRGGGIDVNRASIVQARLNEESNRLALRNTIASTVTSVIQAYRSFVQAREQVGIAEDGLARARELLEVNQALVEAGRMAAVELVQTEASISTQELSVVQARNALDAARLSLLQTLDLDTDTPVVAIEETEAEKVEVDVERALAFAFANRTDFRQSLLSQEIARLNLMLAENGRMWQLDLVGAITAAGNQPSYARSLSRLGDDALARSARIELRIPIGDLSIQQQEVASRVAVRKSEMALAQQREAITVEVRNAVRNVDQAWSSLQIARRSRELAERTLEIEREKLRAGRSSNFQVLSFEGSLNTARTQELSAKIGYLNALTAFDQTLGTTLETWQIAMGE